MAKPKAQTLQQRFGFMDEDLKKPKHDEVMLWLDSCVEEKLADWLGIPNEWTEDEIAELRRNSEAERQSKIRQAAQELEESKAWLAQLQAYPVKETAFAEAIEQGERILREREERNTQLEKGLERVSRDIQESSVPSKPSIRIYSKQWEKPIKSKEYIIGFVDMMVIYEQPLLSMSIELTDQGWIERWNVTFIRYSHDEENRVHFEVKTEIPSLGELIRQINMYRSYGANRFFVVSPDDSHAKLLQEQRIGLIRFP